MTAEAKATPLNPINEMANGVKIQVEIVQKIIKYKVVLIFPIALSILVSGVEIEEKAAFTENNAKEKMAGSHFAYRGMIFRKYGDKTTKPTKDGKIKKEAANIDFSTAFARESLSC